MFDYNYLLMHWDCVCGEMALNADTGAFLSFRLTDGRLSTRHLPCMCMNARTVSGHTVTRNAFTAPGLPGREGSFFVS